MEKLPLVLLVDDDETLLSWMSLLLEEEGFRTERALNAMDAIALMRKEPPAVVVMDIQMPGLDGALVSSLLKETEDLKGIPIILISALPEEESRSKVLESGAAQFLAKPLEQESFLRCVRDQIEGEKK